VDALVVKSDGPHFLLATIHFVLKVKRSKPESKAQVRDARTSARTGDHRSSSHSGQSPQSPIAGKERPLTKSLEKHSDGVIRSDQT